MNTFVVIIIVLLVGLILGLAIWGIVVLVQKNEEGELPEDTKNLAHPSRAAKAKPKAYGTTEERFDFSELGYDRWGGSDMLLSEGLSGVPMRPTDMTAAYGDVSILPYPQDEVLYSDPQTGSDTWERQSRILANIIFLLRRRDADQRMIRKYVLALYYNQRMMAYLMLRRCGEEFARRYFELISRYLRLILTIAMLRARNMDCVAYHTETVTVIAQMRELFVPVGGFEQIEIHLTGMAERVYVGQDNFVYRSTDAPSFDASTFFNAVMGGASASPRATPINGEARGLEGIHFATPQKTVDEMMAFDD